MEVVFLSAFDVAIAGQFIDYLLSFKPVRATSSEPLAHVALESCAWRHAPKHPSARRRALKPALFNSHDPPSVFGRHVTERVKDALTACIWVGLVLCTRS